MNSSKKKKNLPRATKTVKLKLGKPNTADYLCKEYQLPKPYKFGEYRKALDDLQKCWENGERTPQEEGANL